jgi:hypothetical protein
MKVLDMTGRTVFNYGVLSRNETIDLSFLTRGLYIVTLSDEKNISSYRLIIE